MDIYEQLLKESGNLKNSEEEFSGLDDFISSKISDDPNKIKVASMLDLTDFFRIANDTLVHKSKKDLWRIGENESGEIIIERLFNPKTKKPLVV